MKQNDCAKRAFFKSPAAIVVSAMFGVAWHLLVIALSPGEFRDGTRPICLAAGAITGIIAGWHTIWSRRARRGREGFGAGIANYYLAIFTYWSATTVLVKFMVYVAPDHWLWTDLARRDHVAVLMFLLAYGTIVFGIGLIPLCFLTRAILWRVHSLQQRCS